MDATMPFTAGDVIRRAGPCGTMHVGIYGGTDWARQEWVIHNAKDDCVRWDLLDVFGARNPISLARKAPTAYEGAMVLARARSQLGRKFDPVNFNCEHLVSYALGIEAGSPQLRGVALGAAALAFLALLAA
jgi:hypothetical protein